MSPPKIAKPKGPVARFAWAADTADGYAASSSETLVPADERRALAEGQEVELDEHGTKGLIAEGTDEAPGATKASFGMQTNALMRKSGILQRRSWKTSCCLVTAPFFFCLLVFLLQTMLDLFILNLPENQCGCLCTKCCYWPDDVPKSERKGDAPCYEGTSLEPPRQCTPAARGNELTTECKAYDKDMCGLEYSTVEQVPWCPLRHPMAIPTYLQVPQEEFRAEPNKPNVTVLYTGQDEGVANAIVDRMLLSPDPDFLQVFSVLANDIIPMLGGGGGTEDDTSGLSATKGMKALGDLMSAGLDPSMIEMFFARFPSNITGNLTSALKDQATIDSLTSILKGMSSLDSLEGAGMNEQGLMAVLKNDNSNPLVQLSNNVTDVVTRQNTLGTERNSQIVYYVEEAMTSKQYLMRRSCDLPVPPPFNETPFQYECLPTNMVHKDTAEKMNEDLFCGWKEGRLWLDCPAEPVINAYLNAYDFKDTTRNHLDVDVSFNATGYLRGGGQGPGRNHRTQEAMNVVTNAFLKYVLGSNEFSAAIRAIKEMPKLQTSLDLDFASILGPLLYMLTLQLLFPVMLQQLVYEKFHRLRIMMKMHGLSDGVYWLVTYLWYLILSVIYFVILMVFGAVIGLKFFTLTNPGVMIIFFFVFSNTQIAFAFLLSTLFQNPRTVVTFGFIYVFALSFMSSFLIGNLVDSNSPAVIYLELLPAFALFRGLYEFSNYAFMGNYQGTAGMTFSRFGDEGNGMVEIIVILLIEFPIFMCLAWYLEQVLGQIGTRKHWLFCFGGQRLTSKAAVTSAESLLSNDAPKDRRISMDSEDVREERVRVENMASYKGQAIVLRSLKKVYPPQGGKPAKTACKALTMAVERGECFGLLGPNGAGKSTSINMMVGFLTPSGGTALINGLDILKDMDAIYPMMGVCPQHDLLWDTMTAREHLLFYGRLKGLKKKVLADAADQALKSVNLFNNGVGNKQVQTYSGGMKRRLSVAISLIGDPRVVYLDEPSTGLDPASRRNLWDVIKEKKTGRAIILTTHSMEEAEVLCDRLGIFVDGALQCIGNPKELTSTYGGYLVFTITTPLFQADAAAQAVKEMCPQSLPTYSLAGTQKFEMPSSSITISEVFTKMQAVKEKVEVLDWGVANASLEEVFIKVAKEKHSGEYV